MKNITILIFFTNFVIRYFSLSSPCPSRPSFSTETGNWKKIPRPRTIFSLRTDPWLAALLENSWIIIQPKITAWSRKLGKVTGCVIFYLSFLEENK